MQEQNYLVKNGWNDFYDGSVSPNYQKTETGRVELTSTNAYIFDCLFNEVKSTKYGGAIYSKATSNLLIESCIFYFCKTSGEYGGTIYFTNTNTGQCTLNKVCAIGCNITRSSDSRAQFLYVQIKNDNNRAAVKCFR